MGYKCISHWRCRWHYYQRHFMPYTKVIIIITSSCYHNHCHHHRPCFLPFIIIIIIITTWCYHCCQQFNPIRILIRKYIFLNSYCNKYTYSCSHGLAILCPYVLMYLFCNICINLITRSSSCTLPLTYPYPYSHRVCTYIHTFLHPESHNHNQLTMRNKCQQLNSVILIFNYNNLTITIMIFMSIIIIRVQTPSSLL